MPVIVLYKTAFSCYSDKNLGVFLRKMRFLRITGIITKYLVVI